MTRDDDGLRVVATSAGSDTVEVIETAMGHVEVTVAPTDDGPSVSVTLDPPAP